MGEATYNVPSFLGGEYSQFAQGRFDRPEYRTALNVCLNMFPVEMGALTRRPGTQHASPTRGGLAGRVIKFDFEQADPVTMEFTSGTLRFRNGAALVTTNDTQTVSAISTANPAVVNTATASGWATGNTVMFSNPSTPLIENRQFLITVVDTKHFSLADALTGTSIDGSTLGALAAGATVSRVQELATSYIGTLWSNIRAVQAETTSILLSPTVAPQALTVTALPTATSGAAFALQPAKFEDGPYLDPFTNGVVATPNQATGIIQITLSFPLYVASTSYGAGDFVTSSSVNYESLVDQNIGNTPASSPTAWQPVSAAAAINPPPSNPNGVGRGFLATDIGRAVRLFSEPALWAAASTYIEGAVVSYNPTGAPGAATYWQSLVGSNIGNIPGVSLTYWQLVAPGAALPSIGAFTSPAAAAGPAQWTWGKITSLANSIAGNVSGVAQIGTMAANGGLAAAFNGVPDQNIISSATGFDGTSGAPLRFTLGVTNNFYAFVGQNFSGTAATAYAIQSVTITPPSDQGLVNIYDNGRNLWGFTGIAYLYASNSPPAAYNAGTLLGEAQFGSEETEGAVVHLLGTAPVTIASSDTTTAYAYVWVVLLNQVTCLAVDTLHPTQDAAAFFSCAAAQVQFIAAAGTAATAAAANVELLGPPLLYTTAIRTWQLGAFSDTTGWPTCGCYDEGRLWLSGAIPNRFDACYSNGIDGGTINFAPTDQYGVVTAANAISETLNSDSVNPIYWMEPDQQGIIMGTQNGEWLISAPTPGPISASNIAARRATKIGCANIEPRRTEHTTVFAQRYARKLMEYFADVFSGKFTAPNIADKAQHIVRNFIAELAYTSAATPIIWGRDALGAWFGCTYKRDTLSTSQGPTFNGWHRHQLGSGRAVQSICAGPSTTGDLDTLTMVTLDPATNIYHVELLTEAGDEQTPLAQAWFLDDAVNPSSTSTSNTAATGAPYGGLTINGLWHLNGKTVQVFAGGVDCGDRGAGTTGFTDFTVANGSIFVPYGDGLSAGSGRGLFTAAFAAALPLAQIVVGFTYTSQGQLVRPIMPAETGARNGPALAKTRRTHRSGALLSNTLGISFGTNFTVSGQLTARFTLADMQTNIAPLTTFSGVFAAEIFDQYSYDSMICWQITRPWPATVVAIAGNLQTQDQ